MEWYFRRNSRFIQGSRYSRHHLFADFTERIYAQLDLNEKGKERVKSYRHLSWLLVELFLLWRDHGRNAGLVIPKNRNSWYFSKAPLRYNLNCVINLLSALTKKGFVEHKAGFRGGFERGSAASRYRPTRRLISGFAKVPISAIEARVDRVQIRDSKKKLLPLPEAATPLVKEVERYVRMLDRHRIRVPIRGRMQPITLLDLNQIRRVFTQDLEHHGRLYARWCFCTEEERSRILIDNKAVVEHDFKNMAVRIMYALEGKIPPDGDLYDPVGIVDGARFGGRGSIERKFVKHLTILLLNSKTLRGVVASLNIRLKQQEPELAKYYFGMTDRKPSLWAKRIQERHSSIKEWFLMERALEYMNIDSQICMAVLSKMVDRHIPCLSVHDSFIVMREHEYLLRQAMIEAFADVTGVTSTGVVDEQADSPLLH